MDKIEILKKIKSRKYRKAEKEPLQIELNICPFNYFTTFSKQSGAVYQNKKRKPVHGSAFW